MKTLDDKPMVSLNNEARLAQSIRWLHTERVVVVRFSLLLNFFYFAHAQCVDGMRTSLSWRHFPSTTWVMMPKSITPSPIPEFFILQAPWLIPCGTESWPARTPWVLGFFFGREKPLVLWGGTGVCPPGKREGGLPELLTVLAVIPKENYLLDPCVDF